MIITEPFGLVHDEGPEVYKFHVQPSLRLLMNGLMLHTAWIFFRGVMLKKDSKIKSFLFPGLNDFGVRWSL